MSFDFQLPGIYGSGMILQQKMPITISGTSVSGQAFCAELIIDAANSVVSQVCFSTDSTGAFDFTIPPTEAGTGYSIKITHKESREIVSEWTDIAFGEVWIASGQSNMEFFLKYEKHWEDTKKLPLNRNIRTFNVPQVAFEGHTTHNKVGYGYWMDASDPAFEVSSAPGYSFALEIAEAQKVPVGIIGCNWGGCTASCWLPEEYFENGPLSLYKKQYDAETAGKDPDTIREESLKAWAFEDSDRHGRDFEPLLYGRDREWQLQYMKDHAGEPVCPMGPYHFCRPGGLYHTMLETIIGYPMKGVIWYQGESDCGDRAPIYDILLSEMIQKWRDDWGYEFPFLQVQLAPFGIWLECTSADYTTVRFKQEQVTKMLPKVYMASIMDLGSYYDIHPKEKMEVGRRLALLARNHVYGENDLLCESPSFSGMHIRSSKLIVSFRDADGLSATERGSDISLSINGQAIDEFVVSAADNALIIELPRDIRELAKEFSPDPASSVSAKKNVLNLSIGWGDFAEIFIHNKAGLPIRPFKAELLF